MKRLLALLLSLMLLTGCDIQAESPLLAAPDDPVLPRYGIDDAVWETWRADVSARSRIPVHGETLTPFITASTTAVLSGSDGENRVYSPVSLFTALAMLAETTGGETRAEALDLLGCADMAEVRLIARSLWEANARDDGAVTRLLAASLWLDSSLPFSAETVAALAEHYRASSFRGHLSSPELSAELRAWLNRNTLGLLEEQTSALAFPPDTVMALASTVAFRARWINRFYEGDTALRTFHAPQGDTSVPFMHATRIDTLCWGDRFQAVCLPFDLDSGAMWLILPDAGVSPEELLADADCLSLIATGDCRNGRTLRIHLAVPKFDVTSEMELSGVLRTLGLTQVFDPAAADFTPLTGADVPVSLSRVQHDARVLIDEEGCEAAAYTVMMMAGAMPPLQMEEIDFVLDRPFLFLITGAGGLPLFVGVINTP